MTNFNLIKSLNIEEMAEFLVNINPNRCSFCAFSQGWKCQPDKNNYSDFEKCKEGRKRWLESETQEDNYGNRE